MNLGIFLPNWIGDVVMATPALAALRDHFPHARIIGIGRPFLTPLLAGTSFCDELLLFDPRAQDRALRGRGFYQRLRAARLDQVVLMTHSLRTALWAWASGARRRVGFARNGRSWLLTERLHQPRSAGRWVPAPVMHDYLRLAEALGAPIQDRRIQLATTADDEAAADAAWRALDLPTSERVVVINSSGAFGAAKLWPQEHFAELARRLAQEQQLSVLVMCGPSEREIAREIATRAAHPRVRSLADQPLGLGLSKAVVRRSRLLVTTDSGPRHFAAAFGVPVVTIFGPTHIAWSETDYDRALHVQHAVPCGPCQERVCPLGHHRCMRDLSVERVMSSALELLDRYRTARAA